MWGIICSSIGMTFSYAVCLHFFLASLASKDLDPTIRAHSLRHFRITYLVMQYGFEPYALTAIARWTYRTGLGHMGLGSGQLDAYLYLAWKHYFPKLLKPIMVLSS
jgi:hypothetical protein